MISPKFGLAALLCACYCAAQPSRPIQISLDITDAPRKILRAQMRIPVQPGPTTLMFPEWIPGEHGPTGPIDNFTGLVFSANGQVIPWQRDDINMYAFHVAVPEGIDTLDVKTDFLATAAPTGFSAGASTSANLCLVSWNEFLLYPANVAADQVTFEPSIKVPTGWQLGTALSRTETQGDITHFKPVSLEMLVDSPLLAGRYFREVALATEITPSHYLDMAADGPEDLQISKDDLESFSNLVRETGALYKSRHYESYHFLVTLSDSVAHFGLEHHQSSDDRVEARTFIDEDTGLLEGDLLPHEFTHSWNGKYRRPVGLATPNYQQPMRGELLWVYEGLTQYLGDVLAARSGIWTEDQYREYLASSAASLDHRPGRTWRDLQDTATSAQILYNASNQWDNWRRSVDYYAEGELIWLEVDTTIRKLSGGKKSLNDFCARFLGLNGNTRPIVVPYTFEDVVANLNAIQPHDWSAFFKERLTTKADHAPLGGIGNAGYHIDYTAVSNDFIRANDNVDHGVDAWYSLGLKITDNTIDDVLIGSPAYNAGLGPSMKIVAVNARQATDELLRAAVRDSKKSSGPIELIVENTGYYKVVKIEYHGGERFPHLVRDKQSADLLADILKPMTNHPETKAAE